MASKNFENKVELLEKLLNQNLKLLDFFQSDLTKYKILLIVMLSHYQNKNYTIEKIIETLPKDISSRAHQLNCISDATAKGYLFKVISKSDKRKKYLKPSQDLITQVDSFLKKL